MASLLAKAKGTYSHHLHPHYLAPFPPLLLRLSLSLSTQSQQSKPPEEEEEEIPFIARYLVSSFDFSPDRALKLSASLNLRCIKAPDRPDSVVRFLEEIIGLSDSQVRSLISSQPMLLKYNVEKILKPRACALIDAGFSGEMLIQLIQQNPHCLSLKDTLSRLQFWRNFVGNHEDTLLKLVRKNRRLMQTDISKRILPKLNLLKEYGLSDQLIIKLLTGRNGYLLSSLDCIRRGLKQFEELGISRQSNMFFHVLRILGCSKKETLEKKMAFFKEIYGWSEEETCIALRKSPSVFGFSEETVKSKMDFLIKKADLEPRSIASQSILLSYSLESRLIPRHNVLSALQAKGLIRSTSLLNACVLSEKRFLERFVVPYVKIVPELGESYAACFDNYSSLASREEILSGKLGDTITAS